MMRHTMIESTEEDGDGETKYELDVSLMASIFALFGRTKELRPEPTAAQIAQLEEFLKVCPPPTPTLSCAPACLPACRSPECRTVHVARGQHLS